MSTMFLAVTWDEEDHEKCIAVWTCSANNLAMNSWGVWENTGGRSAEGLKEELTPEEFTKQYDLDINYYCRPGGKFTIRGEVSWFCQAADRRMI